MTTTSTHTDRYKNGLLFVWWRSDDATREEGSEAFASTDEKSLPLAHFPPILSFWHLNSTSPCVVRVVVLCAVWWHVCYTSPQSKHQLTLLPLSFIPKLQGPKMKTTTSSSFLLPLLGLLLVLSPPTHAFTLHSFFGSSSSAASAPPAPLKAAAGVATTEEAALSKVHT